MSTFNNQLEADIYNNNSIDVIIRLLEYEQTKMAAVVYSEIKNLNEEWFKYVFEGRKFDLDPKE